MKKTTIAWLAGLLEGEGSFLRGPPSNPNQPRISIQMTDLDVIRRVAVLFRTAYVQTRRKQRQKHWKQSYCLLLRGTRALALMRELRPYMGKRRQGQIDAAIASYTKKPFGPKPRISRGRSAR